MEGLHWFWGGRAVRLEAVYLAFELNFLFILDLVSDGAAMKEWGGGTHAVRSVPFC